MPERLVACPDCHGRFPDRAGPTHAYVGASPGCWEAFGLLAGRELALGFTGPERLSVHAYMAQHPGIQGRRQAQSVDVHLMVLHCVIERGDATARVVAGMTRWLRPAATHPWLQPPAVPATMTVADVALDLDRDAHEEAVRRWADAVWASWAAHHDLVRRWVDRADRP